MTAGGDACRFELDTEVRIGVPPASERRTVAVTMRR